jgi:hypothetical protein
MRFIDERDNESLTKTKSFIQGAQARTCASKETQDRGQSKKKKIHPCLGFRNVCLITELQRQVVAELDDQAHQQGAGLQAERVDA